MNNKTITILAIATTLVIGAITATPVFSQTPTCNGLEATLVVPAPNGPIFHGTDGDDVIVGTSGDDNIRGGLGNDTICGLEGDDTIRGEEGDDTIFGGPGNDDLKGMDGNDKLFGQEGRDVYNGGQGIDSCDAPLTSPDVQKCEIEIGNGGTEPPDPPTTTLCSDENIQHWNKIKFTINLGDPNRVAQHPTLPDLPTGTSIPYEVLVTVEPGVQVYSLQKLVSDEMNQLGYEREHSDGMFLPMVPNNINNVEVEYSVVCLEQASTTVNVEPTPVNINVEPTPVTDVTVTNDETNPIPVTGIVSSPVCPAENVQHWMMVRTGISPPLIHPTNPDVIGTIGFTMQFDPDIPISVTTMIKERLVELGYTTKDGSPITGIDISSIADHDIEHSIFCAEQ